MNTKLKAYFPMIRTREEILRDIQQNINLTERFYSWKEEQREEFLDFCTGVKGVKMLYDAFFKEIMNPETVPERLEDFLEVLLQRKVKIIEVLPGDSTRLADEQSLLIMDILVRFDDGSYCNVEVQKIGYAFPGERCACYSSDLLLRQYKNARSTRKEKFSYKDIKSVYTIVLIDKSTGDFHKYKDRYCHIFQQRSDTGLELNLLQKYVFLPLDIFRENMHNKGITDKLDAWLAFLSMDSPEVIVKLIKKYPEFTVMYEHIYNICRNVEGMMEMYSEELLWCPKKDTIRRQCRRQRIKDRRIKTLICEQTIRFGITGGKINEQKRRKHLQKKRWTMGSQIYQGASDKRKDTLWLLLRKNIS